MYNPPELGVRVEFTKKYLSEAVLKIFVWAALARTKPDSNYFYEMYNIHHKLCTLETNSDELLKKIFLEYHPRFVVHLLVPKPIRKLIPRLYEYGIFQKLAEVTYESIQPEVRKEVLAIVMTSYTILKWPGFYQIPVSYFEKTSDLYYTEDERVYRNDLIGYSISQSSMEMYDRTNRLYVPN